MIDRLSGAWMVSASKNQSHSPWAWRKAWSRAWVLPVQPGGRCSIEKQSHAAIARGELARDLAGPVGAAIVDDQDLEIRIGLPADGGEAVGEVELFILGGKDRRDERWVGMLETRRVVREDSLATENDLDHEQRGSARSRRARRRSTGW